jgi:hypothetical protein
MVLPFNPVKRKSGRRSPTVTTPLPATGIEDCCVWVEVAGFSGASAGFVAGCNFAFVAGDSVAGWAGVCSWLCGLAVVEIPELEELDGAGCEAAA